MIDIDLMIKYQQLFEDVSQTTWADAHFNSLQNLKLPKRGPQGDPINEVRVNIFLSKVIDEIHRLRDERGGENSMEGIITFEFEGKKMFEANIWEIVNLLILHRWPSLHLIPDKIFIDHHEISKPENMEDDT